MTQNLWQFIVGKGGEFIDIGKGSPLLAAKGTIQVRNADLRPLIETHLFAAIGRYIVERRKMFGQQSCQPGRAAARLLNQAGELSLVSLQQDAPNFTSILQAFLKQRNGWRPLGAA